MSSYFETSFESFRKFSDEGHLIKFSEKEWEWAYLKKQCKSLELEKYYQSYMQRLRMSSLAFFAGIEIIIVSVHSIILLCTVLNLNDVCMDICIYIVSAVIVLLLLSLNFRDKLIERKPWIMMVTSTMAILILSAADIGIPIYHATYNEDIICTTYHSYIIFSVYIFMPLRSNLCALLLGLTVTVIYMSYFSTVSVRKGEDGQEYFDWVKLASEGIFMVCVNVHGLYFRVIKEFTIRTTFLDRRQCVEQNLLLHYAREQEKTLLLNIIPAQIANKIEEDVKVRIEMSKEGNYRRYSHISEVRKLFIEPHNDVTILYADVVNYTHLTTTLDVKTLVETIHDLFVKFDTASEELNVLRIKFLGDCYYCVAGVPLPNEYHAHCCVDLGLRMITDVREVSIQRKLDIDMRIGVHSGNILSGVIGACKWQFDIWSKDVDIANRLEATGQAGRVHVSEQTLKLLDGEYIYEEGTAQARTDEVLHKYCIRTFLIKGPKRQPSIDTHKPQIAMPQSSLRDSDLYTKPDLATNFMQNTLTHLTHIRNLANLKMSHELDKMPVRRTELRKMFFGRTKRLLTEDEIEEQNFLSNITSMCLFFTDWRWEYLYMREPDVMMKYSLVVAFITSIGIITLESINKVQSMPFWYMAGIVILTSLSISFVAWYKRIWILCHKEAFEARNATPKSKLSAFLYHRSENTKTNVTLRIGLYLMIGILLFVCTLFQLLDCDRIQIENEEIEIQLFQNGDYGSLCFNPLIITESVMLVVSISFLCTRIPFVLKISMGVTCIGAYTIIVVFEYDFIFVRSPSTNVGLYPEYSHLLVLLIVLFIYYLMERQTEFISKVDYNWKRRLQKKQEDAKFTNETIKILINNILPTHVADIYMRKRVKNELYYEEYDNVAVMFATILNYDTEKVGLRVLNEIICDFDQVLSSYQGPLKVEKIKLAGWTYMAACGLDPAGHDHIERVHPNRSFESRASRVVVMDPDQPTKSEAASRPILPKSSQKYQTDVVFVMAKFALDLMRCMHSFNMENLQYEDDKQNQGMLRIGISNGAIMAGVVGSYKPHYDIWGHAVNMASRMDSTGKPGAIQVTKSTARVLQDCGIECTLRGLTYVKGRGEINTYFVGIDDDLNFMESVSPSVDHDIQSLKSDD